MKKKIFGSLAIVTIALIVAFNVNLNIIKKSNNVSLLDLTNVEALAGLEEWWNRLDWNCDSIPCYYFGVYSYDAEVPVWAGAGEGEVAHAWICTGCA